MKHSESGHRRDDATQLLVRELLKAIGIDQGRIDAIFQGAPMYAHDGLLDSVNLISLITVLSDHYEANETLTGDLFDLMDENVFDAFHTLDSLTHFLHEKT
ncbi:hypothetical protein [Lonsdalea quercina]|uniref:hypothetical protein n=1 Tax=Lonsdalea quercina TaxID=71657 RepID=UPI003975F85E